MAGLCSMFSHIFQESSSALDFSARNLTTLSLPGWGGGTLWYTLCSSECQLRTWIRQRPLGRVGQTCEDSGPAGMGRSELEEFSTFLQAGQALSCLSVIAQEAMSFSFQGGAKPYLHFKTQFKHDEPLLIFLPIDRISSSPSLCPPMFYTCFPTW